MLVDFECPKCKGHICEIWALNGSNLGIKLMYWHMFLNPGLAVNELLLGQRFPSRLYVCKACELPLADRTFVHCPECDSFLDGRLWSYGNAFGHWLGLFCPTCGGEIPCLRNLTTAAILAVSAPILWLPQKLCKDRLLPSQKLRIARAQNKYLTTPDIKQRKPVNYWRMGLLWGLSMDVIFSFFLGARSINWIHGGWTELFVIYGFLLLKGLLIWLPAGAVFAVTCKLMMDRKGDVNLHLTYDADGQVVPLKCDIDEEAQDGKV